MTIEELKRELEVAKANVYRWDGVANYLVSKIAELEAKAKKEGS